MQNAEARWLRVVLSAQLANGQTAVFRYERDGQMQQGFVLRRGQALLAFANRCPHWQVFLDLGDERFYDPRIDRIYCKNHGATFLPEDGSCDSGPCFGRRLETFQTRELEGQIEVRLPERTAL